MLVRYTILVSLTFILLSELSRILIKMHEGSKYVLQIYKLRVEISNEPILAVAHEYLNWMGVTMTVHDS